MNSKKLIKDSVFALIIIFLVCLFIVLVAYPIIKSIVLNPENFNGSGYGMNSKFGNLNTIVPFNTISKSTDFKLFSLVNQIKYLPSKNPLDYVNTGTSAGIIHQTPKNYKNVILFSGLCDMILKQNGYTVWPHNLHAMKNDNLVTIHNNNNGHFNTIVTLLKTLKYTNNNINTILYDFRNINIDEIVQKLKAQLKKKSVIIAYDFGCVIANICISKLNSEEKALVDKYLLICPTIGGTAMTIRDYFSGSGEISPEFLTTNTSVLLSMPNQKFYSRPVMMYEGLGYNAKDLNVIMEKLGKPATLYKDLMKLQEASFQNPDVNCIIVANNEYNTPIAYDYGNSLQNGPKVYNMPNSTRSPNGDIHSNNTVEGIQENGDKVVPFNNIKELYKMWNTNNKCSLEIIQGKDHFTILKSYELALIIIATLK